MSLNQSITEKKTCFYHPSKVSEPPVQCQKCKQFVCHNDLKIFTNENVQTTSEYCPICYLKEEKLKFYILTLHIFIPVGFILGPLLSIAGLEALILTFLNQNYLAFILSLIFEPMFIAIAVIMIMAPFKLHKNISQLEYKTYLFLQLVTVDKDQSILKYQSKLATKFASKDFYKTQQKIILSGNPCPSCGSVLSTKHTKCSNCGAFTITENKY